MLTDIDENGGMRDMEDIDYRGSRGLDKRLMVTLAGCGRTEYKHDTSNATR